MSSVPGGIDMERLKLGIQYAKLAEETLKRDDDKVPGLQQAVAASLLIADTLKAISYKDEGDRFCFLKPGLPSSKKEPTTASSLLELKNSPPSSSSSSNIVPFFPTSGSRRQKRSQPVYGELNPLAAAFAGRVRRNLTNPSVNPLEGKIAQDVIRQGAANARRAAAAKQPLQITNKPSRILPETEKRVSNIPQLTNQGGGRRRTAHRNQKRRRASTRKQSRRI